MFELGAADPRMKHLLQASGTLSEQDVGMLESETPRPHRPGLWARGLSAEEAFLLATRR